jgi:hypothetical protein
LQADLCDALAVHCTERAKTTREFINVEDVMPKATNPAQRIRVKNGIRVKALPQS